MRVYHHLQLGVLFRACSEVYLGISLEPERSYQPACFLYYYNMLHSVSNGSNPLERFRVRVGTGTEPWQRFYHMENPDRWHLGRFPPQNPAFASPDVSIQLSI